MSIVYSTNPDFKHEEEKAVQITLPPHEQRLQIVTDRKHRAGKTVTLVRGFAGTETDMNDLMKKLKIKCGAGGSARDGVILIQGDFREKISQLLKAEGYKVR